MGFGSHQPAKGTIQSTPVQPYPKPAAATAPAQKDQRLSLFIMPTDIFRTIREELLLVAGPEKTAQILFNCGYKAGQKMTEKMNITAADRVNIGDTLVALWIEIGLGRLSIKSATDERFAIESDDSTEALANGITGKKTCDLTCGYFSGIISALTAKRFICIEEGCISRGDARCTFVATGK